MGKILEYIQKQGNGKFQCYKTKKISLDLSDNDTLDYDDKARIQTTSSKIAETDRSRVGTVPLKNLIKKDNISPPLFHFFLDGSRHTYKVDDIGIGKKIFPIVAGQIIVGCCEKEDRDTFKKFDLCSKIVMAMPDDFDDDSGGVNFCRSYCENLNNEIAKNKLVKEETNFSDIVKCEMLLLKEDQQLESETINLISTNLIREAYPVCYGSDTRWANHLYPIYLINKKVA